MRTRRHDDDFGRGCRWAALLLGPSFGAMAALGILLGW